MTTRCFLVEDVELGVNALQFVDYTTEADLKLSLSDEHESSIETTFELATLVTSDFQNVTIKNKLWFLAGQLCSFSMRRQVQNYLVQPGNLDTTMSDALGLTGRPPASLSAIQALSKEKIDVSAPGELGEEVCPICVGPMEATKLPCGYWFHFDCVKPWIKKHDSCPSCRASIKPTDT